MRALNKIALILAAAPLAAACKQKSIGANLAEAGGTAAAWNMAATLDPNGSIYVDAQGADSDLEQFQYTGLALQIASSPDGQVFELADKKYFALASSDSEILYNVLVTTRGGYTCYTNAVKVDGTGYTVACKNGLGADAVDTLGPLDERQRANLADACQRLATTRIDVNAGTDFYARYDKDRNRLACTCVNGRSRDVEYASYANRSVSEFEDDCRLKAGAASNSDVNGLSAAQKAELVHRECDNLAGISRGVSCQAATAVCGEVSRRQLSYELYNGQTATFRADCSRELAAGQAANPGNLSPLAQLQSICLNEVNGALSSDRQSCDCPNGARVLLSTYLGRNDAFGDACL